MSDLKKEAWADLESHRSAWRQALEIALVNAEVRPPDIDDKSYWRHEIEAFDRTFSALLAASAQEPASDAAAIAALRAAQSVYRANYDEFPLRNTWESVDETIRDGWRKIAAAAVRAASPSPAQEPVWLIEWPDDGNLHPLRWWHGEFGYTRDPNKTPRFTRREDAEMGIKYLKLVGAKAVEHMWMNGKVTRPSPSPAQEPVAWMAVWPGCVTGRIETSEGLLLDYAARECPPGTEIVPLYAHPSPSPSLTKAREASEKLGAWMSAALDDPDVCDAMKADINAWFAALAALETTHG